jgi:hypothetical protein
MEVMNDSVATSPYMSLRRAVRPAILAHCLLAEDQERAGKLAAECEDLLFLTRELLKAAGLARLLDAAPSWPAAGPDGALAGLDGALAGPEGTLTGPEGALAGLDSALAGPDGSGRPAQLLDAYAEAGLLWAKVVGSTLALAGALISRGEWEDVRRLAGFLADAGEEGAAADLRIRLGNAVWEAHREQLQHISRKMPPDAIAGAIDALRAVLREVPEDFPDRNREVNRFLAPLASAIHAIMRDQGIDIPYNSRVEHIATGGVAKYPDIVMISLDELAAEFEGTCG